MRMQQLEILYESLKRIVPVSFPRCLSGIAILLDLSNQT